MINRRIFGSDLHYKIKGVLEAKQLYAETSNPNESISLKNVDPLNPHIAQNFEPRTFLPKNINFETDTNARP